MKIAGSARRQPQPSEPDRALTPEWRFGWLRRGRPRSAGQRCKWILRRLSRTRRHVLRPGWRLRISRTFVWAFSIRWSGHHSSFFRKDFVFRSSTTAILKRCKPYAGSDFVSIHSKGMSRFVFLKSRGTLRWSTSIPKCHYRHKACVISLSKKIRKMGPLIIANSEMSL